MWLGSLICLLWRFGSVTISEWSDRMELWSVTWKCLMWGQRDWETML